MASELSMAWAEFLEEYGVRNSTEFKEEYPTLAKEIQCYEQRNSDAEQLTLDYVKKAVMAEDIPVDKVLGDYIGCLLQNSRYTFQNVEEKNVIMYLLDEGANFPEEKVIGPNYRDDENVGYDDEFHNYEVKGALIDCVAGKIDLPLLHAIDWTTVKAVYWEYLEGYDSPGKLTQEERWSVLKNYSLYLRKKYPCAEDDGARASKMCWMNMMILEQDKEEKDGE
jgi:hypothetical protein